MTVQHRIFLVNPRDGLPQQAAREHWEDRHGPLFAGLPGLRGYRQNRPLSSEWASGRGWICSETWFDDRGAEATSFATSFYRDVVTPDEEFFLDRDGAWQSAIIGDDVPQGQPAPWRVLWFGDAPPKGPDWRGADLSRPGPGGDGHRRLHSAWFDTETAAAAVTSVVPEGIVAFACRPHSFVVNDA